MRHLATALLVAIGFIPPGADARIAYHDGLPACTPEPGFAAARFEYSRAFSWRGAAPVQPEHHITAGVRFGQDLRGLSAEEGLTLIFDGDLLPCLQVGFGLREPALTLRALWTPVSVGNHTVVDRLHWWQVSGLIGTPRRPQGLGLSYGARVSRDGLSPVGVADYTFGGVSFRLETSLTFPARGMTGDARSQVLAVGLSAEPTSPVFGTP